MDLFLLRHGIAFDPDDPLSPPDEERPLTMKGAARVRRAVRGLRAMGVAPQRVLTSPFLRATQSAKIVREELGLGKRAIIEVAALQPDRAPDELWAELRTHGTDATLCVGHSPNLDRQVAALLGVADHHKVSLKRGGAALLDVNLDRDPPQGSLIWFIPPRTLRKLEQP